MLLNRRYVLFLLTTICSLTYALTGTVGRITIEQLGGVPDDIEWNPFIPLERASIHLKKADTTLYTNENGEFTFSQTVSTQTKNYLKSNHSLNIEANSFILNLREHSPVKLQLYTASGRRVFNYVQPVTSGETIITPGPLAAGIYFAHITVGSESYQKRILRSNSMGFRSTVHTATMASKSPRSTSPTIIDTAIVSYPGMVEKVVPLSSYNLVLDTIAFDSIYSFAPIEVGYVWKYRFFESLYEKTEDVTFEITRIDTVGDTIAVYFNDDTLPRISINGSDYTNHRYYDTNYNRRAFSPLLSNKLPIEYGCSRYTNPEGFHWFGYAITNRDVYGCDFEYRWLQDIGLTYHYYFEQLGKSGRYEKRQELIYYNGLFEFDASVDTLPNAK